METHLALTIIGTVLSLVGILFFLIPEKVNEKVMTDLSDSVNINNIYHLLIIPTTDFLYCAFVDNNYASACSSAT